MLTAKYYRCAYFNGFPWPVGNRLSRHSEVFDIAADKPYTRPKRTLGRKS